MIPSKIVLVSLTVIVLELLRPMVANQRCSSESMSVPKYHLMERCYRSKMAVVGKANFTSLSSCQRLAVARKALALNFSPAGVKKSDVEFSCEVLKCAEADNGVALVNDTAFDYYSLYAKPLPNANTTCVPSIGMFHLLPKHLNYTDSLALCRNMSGVIPDVTSEQRTDALAQVLAGASVDAVFAGLRRNSSAFVGDNANSLDCTTYRAWAPGHPRKNYTKYDCMVITRRKTWLSTPCYKQFPVFCQLIPGGPYKRRSIFAQRQNENDTIVQPYDAKNQNT